MQSATNKSRQPKIFNSIDWGMKNFPLGKSHAIKEFDEYGHDESELIFDLADDKKLGCGTSSPGDCNETMNSDKINNIRIRPSTQFSNYKKGRSLKPKDMQRPFYACMQK